MFAAHLSRLPLRLPFWATKYISHNHFEIKKNSNILFSRTLNTFTKNFQNVFTVEREQALRYVELRRNYAPALYNQRRLLEKPVPSTTQNVRASVRACVRDNVQRQALRQASAVGIYVNNENVSPNVGLVIDEAGPSNSSSDQMPVEFIDNDDSSNEFSIEDNPILIQNTTREEPSNDIHNEPDTQADTESQAESSYDFVDFTAGLDLGLAADPSIDETRSLDLEDGEKPNIMPILDFQNENLHEISNILTGQTANEPSLEPSTEPPAQAATEPATQTANEPSTEPDLQAATEPVITSNTNSSRSDSSYDSIRRR